jgi:hypothetical protein
MQPPLLFAHGLKPRSLLSYKIGSVGERLCRSNCSNLHVILSILGYFRFLLPLAHQLALILLSGSFLPTLLAISDPTSHRILNITDGIVVSDPTSHRILNITDGIVANVVFGLVMSKDY